MKNFDKQQHDFETESDVLIETEEVEVGNKQIVLYNDDFKGKCAVKKGSYEELEPLCTALLERGLTAEIE